MLTGLLALLSSGGVGSLLGLIGGYFNRRLDLQAKQLDHAHELKMKDKDLEYMRVEYEQRTRVAEIEGETAVNVEGYKAMEASYAFAQPDPTTLVGKASVAVRPLITFAFFCFVVYIFFQVNSKVSIAIMNADNLEKLYMTIIEWILFQAGVCIGWWFANRQSGPSMFGGKQ